MGRRHQPIRAIENRITSIRTKLGITPNRPGIHTTPHTDDQRVCDGASDKNTNSCECDTNTTKNESNTVPEGAGSSITFR